MASLCACEPFFDFARGLFCSSGFSHGLTQPLSVFLITERLGLPKEQLQLLMAAYGIGMIVGGGLVMAVAKQMAPLILLLFGMMVSAVGFLVMGFSTNLWLTLSAQFIVGLVMPCIQIGTNTMILQNTTAEFVGRVNGILTPLFMGAMVITMSIAGWLKEVFSLVFYLKWLPFCLYGYPDYVSAVRSRVSEQEKADLAQVGLVKASVVCMKNRKS